MAVGEAQVLGQLRDALRAGQTRGHRRRVAELPSAASTSGRKRAHHETEIDTVQRPGGGRIDEAERLLGDLDRRHGARRRRRRHVQPRRRHRRPAWCRRPPDANRTLARGERLAEGTGGRAVEMDRLVDAIAEAHVVVSSTGSAQYLIGADLVAVAAARRRHDRVFVDLALPHDVDPSVADLPGTTLVGLADLGAILTERADVDAARGRGRARPRHRRGRRLPRGAHGEVGRPDRGRPPRRAPPRSSPPRWTGSTSGCPASTRRRAPRSARGAPRRREAAPHADHAGQGARQTAAATTTPPRCASCSTSSPTVRRRRVRQRPPRAGRHVMTALRLGTRRSALATTQSGRVADRLRAARPRGRARRDHDRGRRRRRSCSPRSVAPASSPPPSAGRCSTARSTSPSTRSRTCRPRPSRVSSSPPCRPGRTAARRARRPRRTHPRRAARRVGRRHRLAAAHGPARGPRARPRRSCRSAATSTPGSARLLRRARRRRPGPRRARPPRPSRRGHRGHRPDPDAARPRAGRPRGRVP